MTKKTMPIVRRKKISAQWTLMIGREQKLIADDIFELKKFDGGKKVAAVYEEDKKICFAVLHLDAPIVEFADFLPAPTPGFAIVITEKRKDNKVITIFRANNRFYAQHSDSMAITKLANEKAADDLILVRGILT